MPLKILHLLEMTYNDISQFWGLVLGAWRPSKCLVKEKGVASPKYTAIIKRRSDKWNSWPAPLSFSLGRAVMVNIHIINASTGMPKCLCYLDWRCSKIFRNSFGKNYPWLNIYIRSPLTWTCKNIDYYWLKM